MAQTRNFERLYGELKAGAITRREFGQRAMALGMGAATVAFLCSEGAGFITGQCINVEGGVSVKATTYP